MRHAAPTIGWIAYGCCGPTAFASGPMSPDGHSVLPTSVFHLLVVHNLDLGLLGQPQKEQRHKPPTFTTSIWFDGILIIILTSESGNYICIHIRCAHFLLDLDLDSAKVIPSILNPTDHLKAYDLLEMNPSDLELTGVLALERCHNCLHRSHIDSRCLQRGKQDDEAGQWQPNGVGPQYFQHILSTITYVLSFIVQQLCITMLLILYFELHTSYIDVFFKNMLNTLLL